MRPKLRWIIFELSKLILIIAILTFVQLEIVDQRYAALDVTGNIASAQTVATTRISELERESSIIDATVRQTVEDEVHAFRAALSDDRQALDEERRRLEESLRSHASRLDDLCQGINRIETATFTSSQSAEDARSKVEALEESIRRKPRLMKQEMIYPVVQLRGNGTVGSGVVVYSARNSEGKVETFVFTAYHVVLEILDGSEETEIDDLRFLDPLTDQLDNEPSPARLVASNPRADIALLAVDLAEPWPFVARLAEASKLENITIFDAVYAVGCPLGNKPMPTVGEISSQDKRVDGQNFWMINAPTFFGNSGGGVYLTDSGELVGISSMIYTYGKSQPMVVPHMGLFIPLAAIREWLQGCDGQELAYSRIFSPEAASIEQVSHTGDR